VSNKTISTKQLEANCKNAKKGGVKTPEGKDISKFNALKHGILSEAITEYDKDIYQGLHQRLVEEFGPKTAIEEILVERIALCYLRLSRAAKVETEYVKGTLNPHIEEDSLVGIGICNVVVNEGYIPKVKEENIEKLDRLFLRYEVSIENRFYKALHELERIRKNREGRDVPAPIAVDIDINQAQDRG